MKSEVPGSVRRGEIYVVDWTPGRGSEQVGRRPGVVIQSDAANLRPDYPNTIVAAVSKSGRAVPFHIRVAASNTNGLRVNPSYVKCEQIMTISKSRLGDYLGDLDAAEMRLVDAALKKTMALS